MSTLRVTKVTNAADDGAVEFTKGCNLPLGQSIVNESGEDVIYVNSATGVCTATSFSGPGAGITGLVGTSKSKCIALQMISN